MSFINWGHESPEQLAIRRKMEAEMQALFEQAVRSRSGQSPFGGAGGGSQKSTTVATVESEFIIVPRLGETNWSYYIADYRNNTLTGPKDTGVSMIDYDISTTYSINNGGYVVLFRLKADANYYILFFTDAAGTILETISGYTSDLNTHSMGGRWFAATDYDARLLWYFDGQTVTAEPNYLQSADDDFTIGSNSAPACADGFGLITYKTNGDVTYCIVGNSGVLELFTYNQITSSNLNYEFRLYNMSGVVTLRNYNQSTGYYESIRAFDTATGAQLGSTLDLSGGEYTDSSISEYGSGRYFWIFGSSTEWQVVVYSKELGFELPDPILKSDYPNYASNSDNFSLFSFNNYPIHSTFVAYFYESVGSEYDLDVVNSYKVIYSIDGAAVQTHTFLEPGNGPLKFSVPSINKGHILFLADTGNGEHSVYTINSQGVGLFELGTDLSDQAAFTTDRLGEKHGIGINFNSESVKVHVVNAAGTVVTTSDIEGEEILDVEFDFDAVILRSLTRQWRLNGLTDQLVEIPAFSVSDTSNSYTNPELKRVGIIVTIPSQSIAYTHTQMNEFYGEAALEDFAMDGAVVAGGQLDFGVGSSYFTNLYPGLFVLCAKDVDITSFQIDGDLGADGSGSTDSYGFITEYDGTDYAVYVRRVYGANDPSVNQIIIVNGDGTGIDQYASPDTNRDSHSINGISSSVTELHYLLLAQDENIDDGAKIEDSDIALIVSDYLSFAAGVSASAALAALNLGYETITDRVPNPFLFNDSPNSGTSNYIDDGGGDMYDDGNYLYTTRSSIIARIIKSNSITPILNFPNSSESIQIGPTMIGVLYYDPLNSMDLSLRIYDHSGNLKYTVQTPHQNYQLFDISGARLVLVTTDKVFDGENIYSNTNLYTGTVNSYRSATYNSLNADGYQEIMPNDATWWD
jgi:hypothetical protein